MLRGSEALKKDNEAEHHSPSERILWRNDPDAKQPVALSPLLPRKGRKRARSSSPISSPATKCATPAVDVKKLAQVLKTPRADPALELWDRFAVPGSNASPSGLTNPLIAQLMVSSSPRPLRDGSAPGSERPLRKAVSCGANWPKRRKMERFDSDSGDVPGGKAKSSMVSDLLETVNGEITRSTSAKVQTQQQRKLSSPKTHSAQMSPTDVQSYVEHSPCRPQPGSSPLANKSSRGNVRSDSATTAAPADKPSSDYGDDDFDEETIMQLDASIHLAEGDDFTLVESSSDQAPLAPKICEDDFGDLDDDLFDGVEDLVAEVEANQMSQHNFQGQQHTKPALKGGGVDDDAYGDDDDFGDVDFDAIELAATQAASRPLSSNVRTTA